MAITLEKLAQSLSWDSVGDGSVEITHGAAPDVAGPGALAIALSDRFESQIASGSARVALLREGADWQALGLDGAILTSDGRMALSRVTEVLYEDDDLPVSGISDLAVVHPTATVAGNVSIGPFTTIGPGAVVGAFSRIGARVTIGPGARIGDMAEIHDGAYIGARAVAGDNLTVEPGAVIGSAGFSFGTEGPNNAEAAKKHGGAKPLSGSGQTEWVKTYSLGSVVLGEDVSIGANSTVDAGTLKPTRIGDRTKLDNLVHVGHNVEVGTDCLLCGMTGIAGSVRIGDRVVLAGQTGVGDNLTIGSDVVTGAGTLIRTNVPSGSVLLGYPAMPMPEARRAFKAIKRLGLSAAPGSKPVPKDTTND